ncbi:hypothetical protein FOA52_009074 [Chlamydomonas sp. UWO 241]|nr:hypothetical protein FOA52_009074 [Chlamydomonas sp. UWO 241]
MQSEGALADARPSPVSTDGRSSEASSSGLVCEAVEESVPWQSTAANPYSAIRPAEPRSSFSLRLSVVPYLLWIKDACTFQPWEAVNSYELTPKALLLLPVDNFVRRPMIRLVRWKVFEGFMLLAILANCVTLAMDSSAPGFADTDMGLALKRANYVFIGLFTVECVTKVLALGFVFGQYTYLRNGWNILDFLVVIMGFLELSPIGNYTFIRSFRALRPLRSITKIKALKDIVSALIGSLPMLGDVIILALFFFSVFGVFGLEIFKGIYVYRCAWPDFGTSFIETVDGIDYVMNISYNPKP